ncbi:MAG TPA: uracil-DNA glycosylase [Chthoniobacterales bacterium]|jgi:DNA polymerase
MTPSDSFSQGLDLVLEQLTAQKRLLHRAPSASPALLQTLLQAGMQKAPPIRADKPAVAPTVVTPAPAAAVKIDFLTSGSKGERIERLREICLPCTRCPHLAASRTQVVFGIGNVEAKLMFVGEAPGEDEDFQGEPFVGKAGQLLTKMIQAMGLQREDVYIANVVKCRPNMPAGQSGNRKPTSAEMATCLPYLLEQIDIVRPQAIVALGATAVEGLIGETRPMGQLRGQWLHAQGIPLMATYHPAYLLRNQAVSEKRKVWEDLLMVMEKLDLPISEKQRSFFTR